MNQNNYELYHHGVKGMKWGVRRANRIDRNIRRVDHFKKQNKAEEDFTSKEINIRYDQKKQTKKNERRRQNALAYNKTLYGDSEIINNYRLARLNAKKDKTYKKSEEYKKAKADYSKKRTDDILFGVVGGQQVRTLENLGKTTKQARGQVAAAHILTTVASLGTSAALAYYSSKR